MSHEDFKHANAQPFELAGQRGAVLLVHGFTGSPSHMRPLGNALNAQGWHVKGMLLKGHATTVGDMELTGRWRVWRDAVFEAAEGLRKQHEFVAVAGLSMGGTLTLLAAEAGLCDAAIPMCAPLWVKEKLAALAPIAWPLMRYTKLRPHNMRQGFADDYDYGYNQGPVRCVGSLNRLMRMARRRIADIDCPLLIVQSRRDETVQPRSAETILSRASSANKRLLWLENSPHVCTIGPERELLFAEVAAFLNEVSSAMPSPVSAQSR